MSENTSLMIRDTIGLLIEKAREAKAEKDSSNNDYDIGKLMAFYDVISTIRQQAIAFDISLEDLGLDRINPETELL